MPAGDSLRRLVHRVLEVGLGSDTTYMAGRLTVSPERIAALLRDPALGTTLATWTSPGDSTRIVKVLDAVEPRSKGPGGGGIFPGFLGPPQPQGRGDTHVLRGVAVVLAGYLPRAQEAVVEMSGPGAGLSFLGATHNLVIEFEAAEGASWVEVDDALRRGSLRVAAHLAEAALKVAPDAIEELTSAGGGADLPRIGVITNLQTQGLFKDVFVYGRSLSGGLPIAIDDRDLDDGAVVSGQYGHPGLRNATYLHQNNAVVAELRSRDGADLSFAGVVLAPEPVEQALKELVSVAAARTCRLLGWDAAVVTKEGAGNADADLALKMDALEDLGITAVGIFAEMSGRRGDGPPLVVPPERATAMISSGNYDESVRLPAVHRALGSERLDVAGVNAVAEVEVPTAVILGSLSSIGWGRLTAAAAPA
jgi:sarcosine reductase